ncbi:adenine-specific DNA-methyltransferase [Legionella spiritensis]|uniref:Methyltransferase n=1 Tax=Legionella spiritensis TaxID=452 RepID=A0A0W0Z559_LEGSP|nr:adenine-specific DNA-methyltransferase [Legionella spiritensis]KTD64284.1 DNA adenine methyltransferase YhdJ [Legionella spiritensis]SNV46927.1 DNA adenine methyltransferase YhdJ [Legionella spiritensis]
MEQFEKDGNIIFHGDAIEVLKNEIADESIDLIFVDPPYNIGKKFSRFKDSWPSDIAYVNWSYQWIDECIRVLKPSGTMYLMTSTQAMPYFDLYVREKLTVLTRIVWSYDSSGVQAKKYYGSMYEPILHCVKDPENYTFNSHDILVEAKTGAKRKLIDYRGSEPKPYNTKKIPGNVWEFPRVRYRMDEYEEHPSQKPEALLERIVKASSHANDIILDPFSGTFTTSSVAKSLHRRTIGIDSQEEYIKIGLRRVLGYSEYNGEALNKLQKNTKRKNSNGVKNKENTRILNVLSET